MHNFIIVIGSYIIFESSLILFLVDWDLISQYSFQNGVVIISLHEIEISVFVYIMFFVSGLKSRKTHQRFCELYSSPALPKTVTLLWMQTVSIYTQYKFSSFIQLICSVRLFSSFILVSIFSIQFQLIFLTYYLLSFVPHLELFTILGPSGGTRGGA